MMGADKSNVAVDMRHSKLKREEVEILSGELKKPSWESKNEGIHERVSFEDSIWGFDLAGGAYYKTPLRVVGVKPGSRAEKAGIRPGDRLKRINDIETSTLTIQEAHEIIIESGVHLKLAVTAPEDEEDAYYCYEDPLEVPYDEEAERRREEELARKREVHAKVSSYWSLQWPWVSKRRVIYRESNCFMVPSKYETKHSDRFSPQPMIRTQDDIVLDSIKSKLEEISQSELQLNKGNANIPNGNINNENHNTTNGTSDKNHLEMNNKNFKQSCVNYLGEIPEEGSFQEDLDISKEDNSIIENSVDEISSLIDESRSDIVSPSDGMLSSNEANSPVEKVADSSDEISHNEESESKIEVTEPLSEDIYPNDDVPVSPIDVIFNSPDDEVINEIIENGDCLAEEEALDSVLSEIEEKSIEESGSMHER